MSLPHFFLKFSNITDNFSHFSLWCQEHSQYFFRNLLPWLIIITLGRAVCLKDTTTYIDCKKCLKITKIPKLRITERIYVNVSNDMWNFICINRIIKLQKKNSGRLFKNGFSTFHLTYPFTNLVRFFWKYHYKTNSRWDVFLMVIFWIFSSSYPNSFTKSSTISFSTLSNLSSRSKSFTFLF